MALIDLDAPEGELIDLDTYTPQERPEQGGLIASAKQSMGSLVKGAGQAAADYIPGVDQDNAVKRYGQSVIDANPTAVHNLEDVASSPWMATKEAAGNAGGSIGTMLGARAIGTGITALSPLTGPAAPAVALLGQAISWFGPAAVAALPSYGGIRDKQILNDPANNEDWKSKAIATLGAATVGAIETKFGPQQWALGALTKEGRAELAAKFAETTLSKAIGFGALKGGAIESAEELVQNPIEQLASYDNPLTKESLKDTAFGGVMGALGGGVLGGGAGAAFGASKPAAPAPAPTPDPLRIGNTPDPMIGFPDGTVARRSEVEAYINTLPEDQRVAARAKLQGLEKQPAKPDDILETQSAADAISTFMESVSKTGQDWQNLGVTPTGETSLLSSYRAGQEWQGIAPEQTGSLEQQRADIEREGAALSQARDARLADVGQQWQDLGITSPADDLQAQRMGMREEPNGVPPSVLPADSGRNGQDGNLTAESVGAGVGADGPSGVQPGGLENNFVGELDKLPGEAPASPVDERLVPKSKRNVQNAPQAPASGTETQTAPDQAPQAVADNENSTREASSIATSGYDTEKKIRFATFAESLAGQDAKTIQAALAKSEFGQSLAGNELEQVSKAIAANAPVVADQARKNAAPQKESTPEQKLKNQLVFAQERVKIAEKAVSDAVDTDKFGFPAADGPKKQAAIKRHEAAKKTLVDLESQLGALNTNVQNNQAPVNEPKTEATPDQAPEAVAGDAAAPADVPGAGSGAVEGGGVKAGDFVKLSSGDDQRVRQVESVGDDGWVYTKSGEAFKPGQFEAADKPVAKPAPDSGRSEVGQAYADAQEAVDQFRAGNRGWFSVKRGASTHSGVMLDSAPQEKRDQFNALVKDRDEKLQALQPTQPTTGEVTGAKPADTRLVPVSKRTETKQPPALANTAQPAIESVAEAGPVGRNNVPLSEGGKPYKTKLGADTARKTQPMMRVQRVAGGYALIEKTPAQIAAQEKAAKRLSQPRTSPKGEPIPAHAMIAAAGGLHPNTRADMGMQGNVNVGNRKLFAGVGRGLTIEQATEKLIEEGYLQEGAGHDQARALIKRSLTNPQYTPEGTERMAEKELQEREKAFNDEQEALALAQEADDTEYEATVAAFEAAMLNEPQAEAQGDMSMEDALLAAGYTKQEIDNERSETEAIGPDAGAAGALAQNGQGAAEAAPGRGAQGDAGRDGAAREDQGSGEGLTLTAPSRQDVLAQQAAIDAEAKRKEEGGDKPIPRKQLTGDIPDLFNPQGSVFDAPAEPEAQKDAGETPFTYINGDRAEYTGKTESVAGALFYEVRFTEGRKAGETGATARAPDGTNPLQQGPIEATGIVTPQLSGNPEKFIKVAADSVDKLRQVDVERVLSETPVHFRAEVSAYIKSNRAGLSDEVDAVMADLNEPAQASQTEPKREFRNPDNLNVLHAPIEDKDWFKLKNGEEWQARQGYSGRGWSLVRDGSLHPEARNFESQSDFIRSVIEVTGQTQAAGEVVAPVEADDETIPAVSEAQARKQFEWRNMGQKDGTKSHLLFFFESEKDKGTGAAMNRGEVSLYPGASGWKVEDGDGTSYKSLADAKKAAIDRAIPILQDQGYILKPAQAATAILDAANVTGKERIDALKDVKKGDITPDELQAAYPAKESDGKPEFDVKDPPTFDYRIKERRGLTLLIPPVGKAFDRQTRESLRDWAREAGFSSNILGDNEVSVSQLSGGPTLDYIVDGVDEQRIGNLVAKEKAQQSAKPDNSVKPEAKEGSDKPASFSRGPWRSKPTGLTPTQFTAELTKAFGAKVAERLQAKGVVVPLADQSKLPAHVVPFLRDGDIIYGFYDPKTDRTYAVLENLTPEMVKGLVLHEVGVHFGFEAMLGEAKYNSVMNRLDFMRRAGNKAVKEAYAEAQKNSVRDSQVPEETLAYLVQSSPEMGIIKEIIARIKAFLFSEFGIGGKYLTEADLTMLARAAVDHSSRMEDGGSVVPAFMRNQGGRSADDSTPGASFDAQAAFEKHGGDGDIDESTDIRAKSLAFADMAEATGYEVAGRGDKYVTITKSFGENADGYDKKAVINVRISDHSNVNRGHHFGDTDINIAPDDGYSRDTFEDALRKIKSAYVNDDLDTIIPNESTAPDSGGALARGVDQTGAEANPDIRFSRTPTDDIGLAYPGMKPPSDGARLIDKQTAKPNPHSWDAPEPSQFDDLVYRLQDKQIDTKRVTQAIRELSGQLADEKDVYLQEELFHGRAAARTEDFVNKELGPLVMEMKMRGIDIPTLDEYLHARHAEEANALIADREPSMPDGGSGMTNKAARDYMAKLPAAERQRLEAVAAKVDAILGKTRQMYADYHLESDATVKGWGQMFKHYVPLMREDKDGGMGIGQGFSIKGKETKGRTGSTRKVVDILANIAMQRERAIVRGEKNHVATALVGLAKSNPNPEFWYTGPPPTERVYDPKTNTVVDRADPLYKSRENVVVAKVKQPSGEVKEVAVSFNEDNERAMRMAAALKNLDASQLNGVLGVSAKITRYFAAINTQYNPIFGTVNLVRDFQGALLNLSTTPLKNHKTEIAGHTLSALKGIYLDARAARDGKPQTSAWATLWEEFQAEGGQTGYRDMFASSNDRAKAIEHELNPTKWMDSPLGKVFTAGGALKVPLSIAQKKATGLFNWLSDYNLAMENAVRLSAYKVGLEQGMSKQQAASLAKNLTVNFNRKGQVGQQAGALYAFFNASMQGSARLGKTLFDMDGQDVKSIRLSSTGKKIVYGGMLLGTMQALLLAAAGFDDEEPPDFVRERSLIIPTGGKSYITIPMPLGLHVLPNMGRIPTEFALGGFKQPAKHIAKLMGLTANAFNPVGGGASLVQMLSPTAIDPIVALAENKDWTGKPIAKTSYNKATPGHALVKDTASAPSKVLSEAINLMTGGTKYTAGVFSPTPDQIDYLWGQATGGVGRELSKVQQTASATITGEDLPVHKIPLVGRFYGNAETQSAQSSKFYATINRLNEHEAEIKGLQKDRKGAELSEYLAENPEARLFKMANAVELEVQKMRRMKREMLALGAPQERIKTLEERITARMTQFNQTVARLKTARETATAQ